MLPTLVGFQRLMERLKTSEQVSVWGRILQLLVDTAKLYPQASTVSHKSSVSVDTRQQWSDVSELWFLAMQGRFEEKSNSFFD